MLTDSLEQLNGCVLVVGGAGYIGSHMVLTLQDRGIPVVVLDNLSKGHRDAVQGAPIFVGEMSDRHLLHQIFSSHPITAVIHFASWIDVAESMQFPMKYYQNNVDSTLILLDEMLAHDIHTFIFSSSASVYGEPLYTPIDERHPLNPINPYGRTKRIIEEVLGELSASDHLRYAALRYFNACGADPDRRAGERHHPETHLIPLALQVANGEKPYVKVYGRDYNTPDGTCIRDYVHVSDLCEAHLLALLALKREPNNIVCNLATGRGFSVQEVLETVSKVTRKEVPSMDHARRLGDPGVLVADATRAMNLLKWQPKYRELFTMIDHAWGYHQRQSHLVIS